MPIARSLEQITTQRRTMEARRNKLMEHQTAALAEIKSREAALRAIATELADLEVQFNVLNVEDSDVRANAALANL
jgi:hypothetical protein